MKCQHCGFEFVEKRAIEIRKKKLLEALVDRMSIKQLSAATGIPITPTRIAMHALVKEELVHEERSVGKESFFIRCYHMTRPEQVAGHK